MYIYLAKMDSNLVKNSGLHGQVLSALRNDLPFSQKPAASKVLHIPHGLISSFPNVFKAIAVGKNHCVLQMLMTTLTYGKPVTRPGTPPSFANRHKHWPKALCW